VKQLLALKEQYKKLTGSEYKPSNTSASASAQKENQKPVSAASSTTSETSDEAEKLAEKITQQGDKVRELKANKSAPKVSQIGMRLHFRELAISSDDL
jgi:bifunctional glutamyl/prolyl-tRNA synthetase